MERRKGGRERKRKEERERKAKKMNMLTPAIGKISSRNSSKSLVSNVHFFSIISFTNATEILEQDGKVKG